MLRFERMTKSRLKKKGHARTVRESLKHHFVPHAENNYHPQIFHSKRAIFYSLFFIAIKAFVIGFSVFLPFEAYMASDVLTAQANKILALTNDVRVKEGIPTLDRVVLLDQTASARALDMAENGYFSHAGPDGHTFAYFMKATNHRYVTSGENLAMGFQTANEVVDAWIKSPGHYENLIEPEFKEFGIGISEGVYDGASTIFIAEHFGDLISLQKESVPTTTDTGAKEYVQVASAPQQTPTTVTATMVIPLKEAPSVSPTALTQVADALPTIVSSTPIVIETHGGSTGTVLGVAAIDTSDHEPPPIRHTINAGIASPLVRYSQAKSWFSGFTTVFSVSSWVYAAFLIFFAAALAFSLMLEFRKHHPHAIARAVGMIGLLFVLWKF